MINFEYVERRPVMATAIQWNGMQDTAREIIEWITHPEDDNPERSYYIETYFGEETIASIKIDSKNLCTTIYKGDWVAFEEDPFKNDPDWRYRCYSNEKFQEIYRPREFVDDIRPKINKL